MPQPTIYPVSDYINVLLCVMKRSQSNRGFYQFVGMCVFVIFVRDTAV